MFLNSNPIKINFGLYFEQHFDYYCDYSFGPGAGAASGGLLAVMPRSRSMVRRVAAISGSPLAGNKKAYNKYISNSAMK